jgi:hypothetical protein
LGAKITNAVVQNGNVTITSAQFVVAGGLSYDDKLKALSTLVEHAAASLDLPHEGPIAAEILYRIADERAGVSEALPMASATALQPQPKPRDWRTLLIGAAFWIVFGVLLLAAALLKAKAG